MKVMILLALLALLALGGCAPLVIGTAAGLVIANHENHRDWCNWHYGNPHCWGRQIR